MAPPRVLRMGPSPRDAEHTANAQTPRVYHPTGVPPGMQYYSGLVLGRLPDPPCRCAAFASLPVVTACRAHEEATVAYCVATFVTKNSADNPLGPH